MDGTLDSRQRTRVVAHVDECEACRELAAELARENDDALPPSTSKLGTGAMISERFVVGGTLGKGAMGTVVRAHDAELGMDVALKLLKRERGGKNREAFAREVKVGRKITHPNVCRIYDAGSTAEYDYITMELVEGETLAHLVAHEEIARERALEILAGIAAGVGAAHDVGIVHRDLKPANVMIDAKTGRVVLTDFGFAMDLDSKQSRRLVGTPAYWSPEQARGESATPASDVYSFGVLAYRLLAGRELALSDPHALDFVPREWRRSVAKCVALRPGERFANARLAGQAFARGAGASRAPRLVALALVSAVAVGAVVVRGLTHSPAAVRDPSPAAVVSAPAPQASAALTQSTAPGPAAPPTVPSARSASSTAPSAATSLLGHHPSTNTRPPPSASAPAVSSARPGPAPATSDGDLLYRK